MKPFDTIQFFTVEYNVPVSKRILFLFRWHRMSYDDTRHLRLPTGGQKMLRKWMLPIDDSSIECYAISWWQPQCLFGWWLWPGRNGFGTAGILTHNNGFSKTANGCHFRPCCRFLVTAVDFIDVGYSHPQDSRAFAPHPSQSPPQLIFGFPSYWWHEIREAICLEIWLVWWRKTSQQPWMRMVFVAEAKGRTTTSLKEAQVNDGTCRHSPVWMWCWRIISRAHSANMPTPGRETSASLVWGDPPSHQTLGTFRKTASFAATPRWKM